MPPAEASDGFHLLRVPKAGLAGAQGALRLLEDGDVAEGAGYLRDLPGGVELRLRVDQEPDPVARAWTMDAHDGGALRPSARDRPWHGVRIRGKRRPVFVDHVPRWVEGRPPEQLILGETEELARRLDERAHDLALEARIAYRRHEFGPRARLGSSTLGPLRRATTVSRSHHLASLPQLGARERGSWHRHVKVPGKRRGPSSSRSCDRPSRARRRGSAYGTAARRSAPPPRETTRRRPRERRTRVGAS